MGQLPNQQPLPFLSTPLISWFEIPALNHERARSFYSVLFGVDLKTETIGAFTISFLPTRQGIEGAIISGEDCTPSQVGPLMYLNAGSDLDGMIARVEKAGGMVVLPKTLINEENGFFAIFIDSEGNRLALHAPN
jgi:predicted enzyme related to lactoylglutathione lyase